jgi:hypothetical protein
VGGSAHIIEERRRGRRSTKMEEAQPNEPEKPLPDSATCDDCGLPFKTAQGLAGHRRLAHSTSTARALDERNRELEAHRQALEQRAAEIARTEEATRRREAEVARRQRELAAADSIPEADHLRTVVEEQVGALPEVTAETILRCGGRDYRIQEGRLVHLYWPKGEKTKFEDGEWFQFEGHAYAIRDGRLWEVPPKEILGAVIAAED